MSSKKPSNREEGTDSLNKTYSDDTPGQKILKKIKKLCEEWNDDMTRHDDTVDGHNVFIRMHADKKEVQPSFDTDSYSKMTPETRIKVLKHVHTKVNEYIKEKNPKRIVLQGNNQQKQDLYDMYAAKASKKEGWNISKGVNKHLPNPTILTRPNLAQRLLGMLKEDTQDIFNRYHSLMHGLTHDKNGRKGNMERWEAENVIRDQNPELHKEYHKAMAKKPELKAIMGGKQ